MMPLELRISLPAWVYDYVQAQPRQLEDVGQRMRLVLELGRQNIGRQTGGPFAAAVFAPDATLIAVGVNLVTTTNCSIWHAEMVAIAMAQQALGSYDLSAVGGSGAYELVTSTEPCAMCFGAVPWSGIKRLVCGARTSDACRIGFDEGAKPRAWIQALNKRGITVVRDVLRREAVQLLQSYQHNGGLIYNA